MSNLISATYQDTVILFQPDAYINATQIANKFNKKVKDYLKTDQTKNYISSLIKFSKGAKEYISNLCEVFKCEESALLKTKRGKYNGGTWLHPKLAIDFARWLNPDFAVWCDMQIEKILHPVRNTPVSLPKLTPRQQRHIQGVVKKLVNTQVGSTYSIIWGSVKKEFDVGTYKDIPEAKYPELCSFLKCKSLDGELLPKESPQAELNFRIKHAVDGERFLIKVCEGEARIIPLTDNHLVISAVMIKSNIHREMIPGYRLVTSELYEQLIGIQKQLGELA